MKAATRLMWPPVKVSLTPLAQGYPRLAPVIRQSAAGLYHQFHVYEMRVWVKTVGEGSSSSSILGYP